MATWPPLHHVIACMRTTPLQELVERPAEVTVEPIDLSIVKRVAGSRGCDPRSPQDLVGQKVPDPGDFRLIQEPSFEGRPLAGSAGQERRHELSAREAQRVGTKLSDIRIDAHPTQPARIVEEERSSIVEADGRSDPLGLVGPRSVREFIDPRQAIEEKTPGHPEAHAKGRSLGLEQQKLPATSSGDEGEAWEHHRRLKARDRAAASEVIHLDRSDRPIERSFGEAPVVLDFEDLRHGVEGIGIEPLKVPDG